MPEPVLDYEVIGKSHSSIALLSLGSAATLKDQQLVVHSRLGLDHQIGPAEVFSACVVEERQLFSDNRLSQLALLSLVQNCESSSRVHKPNSVSACSLFCVNGLGRFSRSGVFQKLSYSFS